MPTIAPRFNWGMSIKDVNDTLYEQLNDSYTATANVVNTKPTRNTTTQDPPSNNPSNANYLVGDIWVNTSSNTA